MTAAEHHQNVTAVPQSVPDHIGIADTARIETAIRAFRAWDYQRGGGACYDAVVAYLAWAQRLLGVGAMDPIVDRLYSAVADLHNLTGWTAFDINRIDAAHRHFGAAMELARLGHNEALVANIGYRRGRIHLHHGAPDKALAEFQLGQQAAKTTPSALAAAILYANQAWATAKMGLAQESLTLLRQCENEFARSDPADAPGWADFFDTTDLSAMSGVVHAELARSVDPTYAGSAIPALNVAIDGYQAGMARSKSFTLMALASSHMIHNDVERASVVGAEAVAMAMTVKSTRPKERLAPLKRAADQRRDNATARRLSKQIDAFTAMTPGCSWASTPPPQPCTARCGSPCTTVWRSA